MSVHGMMAKWAECFRTYCQELINTKDVIPQGWYLRGWTTDKEVKL
jgi:hypothetical protein